MTVERYLESQLQKFSILDLTLVEAVYFVVGLLVASLYTDLLTLNWLFYLMMFLLCALPLWIHLFAQKGNLRQQISAYIRTNNPANQVLLFLASFFFALMIASIWPVMASMAWWAYVFIIICIAIKPLHTTWFW